MKKNYYNCIYMYINKENNRKYIGQAQDFNERHRHHIAKSANKYPIDKAFNKYGKENFEIKILIDNVESEEKLNEYEKFFIKRYKTLVTEWGYNISNGGENGHNNFAGKTEEEMKEICKKISENHADVSGENNPMYGRKGEEHPKFGTKTSGESKQKRRETILKNETYKGKNNPMYGIHRYGIDSPNLGRFIDRFDNKGNLIDTKYQFEYVKMGFLSSHISCICKWYECNENKEEWYKKYKSKPRKSTKGYVFKYHKED